MDILSGNFGPGAGDFMPDPPSQSDQPPPSLRAAAAIPPVAIEESDDDVSYDLCLSVGINQLIH